MYISDSEALQEALPLVLVAGERVRTVRYQEQVKALPKELSF